MKKMFKQAFCLVICLAMFSALLPLTLVGATETEVPVPITINGAYFVGDNQPSSLYLPSTENEGYYFCDGSCGLEDHLTSNRWYNSDGTIATKFVAGEYYVYVLTIHTKEGYRFPATISPGDTLIDIVNVDWYNFSNAEIGKDCISVAFRYKFPENDNTIDGTKNVDLPLAINGFGLRGIKEPVSLNLGSGGYNYDYCTGSCGCTTAWRSDRWFQNGELVDEFVDGEQYYYQITIHPKNGYTFDPDLIAEHAINVYGIAWDRVNAYKDEDSLFVEFYIDSYNSETGIPSRGAISTPITVDGSEFVGADKPFSLSLEDTEEYYHCYDECTNAYWYHSDRWLEDDSDAYVDEFIDGNVYYYQLVLHPKAGYYFEEANGDDVNVTDVEWENVVVYTRDKISLDAFFYFTYNSKIGVPGIPEIEYPITIDGSSFKGMKYPHPIEDLEAGSGYVFCDGECCGNSYFKSNTWRDFDDEVVTKFENGHRYYYQVAIHAYKGYLGLDETVDYKDTLINVTGFDWEEVVCYYKEDIDVLYAEFWFTYEGTDDENSGGGIIDGGNGNGGSEVNYPLGDVNRSGAIDMMDYILLKRNYFGTFEFDEEQLKLGDVNKSGAIDMMDYILLKRAYFGTFVLQ